MAKLHTPDSDSDDNASSPSSSSSSETAAKGGGASEYERQRQSRIAENKARLAALGLPNMASSLKGLSSIKNNKKGKEKNKVKEDDDEEYRPDDDEEGEPTSDSSSGDDERDKDEDFVVGNSSGSRKRKQVKNKSSKMKAKVSVKKHCGSNSEYIDDDDDDKALRKAIALSLQDAAEGSSEKNVMNITKAGKKGNIHIQEDKGKKKNKKSFASRLQLTEDEVIVHFFQLDEAGKGAVTKRDLQRAAIAHDFTWTDKELVDMIRCFDSDGDGKLSLDDFQKIIVRCNMIKGS